MPSDRALLAFALALPACVACAAATPGEAFEANRAAILSGACLRAEGFLFASGTARAVNDGKSARQAAPKKAALRASAALIVRLACGGVDWPEALGGEARRTLQDLLVRRLDVAATVSGLTTVLSEEVSPGTWRAVVALPESEAAKVPRLTFAEARERLLREDVLFDPGAPLEALLALRATLGPVPEPADRAPWEALLARAAFDAPRLRALPRLAGRYPLGTDAPPADADFAVGKAAFAKGDLEAAYAAFLASAGRSWAAEALLWAGNVGRRLPGRRAEAAALLLHAAYLRPAMPYPWVHLAFVAADGGDAALAEACLVRAEALGGDDPWVREQAAALRARLPR